MGRLKVALELAEYFHEGQKDKSGEPYIKHIKTVCYMVKKDEDMIVACLHDILEDTDCTLDTIRNIFGDTIAKAVEAITKRKDEDYFDYINRVAKNNIARRVKMADLLHNMQLNRLQIIRKSDVERVKKYTLAYKILLESFG